MTMLSTNNTFQKQSLETYLQIHFNSKILNTSHFLRNHNQNKNLPIFPLDKKIATISAIFAN